MVQRGNAEMYCRRGVFILREQAERGSAAVVMHAHGMCNGCHV